jgi:acyl-coenzyme A thioesterase PaaI-like protein
VAATASVNPIRSMWDRLHRLPAGRLLFSAALGRTAPYTGTIRPRVVELRNGYARVEMADRRAVRNHLRSIHAIALMNLAEVTTGLALHYGLPDHARAILTSLSIDFLKKGRGRLTAEATVPIPDGSEPEELELTTTITDASGDEVARAQARWLVGPRPK